MGFPSKPALPFSSDGTRISRHLWSSLHTDLITFHSQGVSAHVENFVVFDCILYMPYPDSVRAHYTRFSPTDTSKTVRDPGLLTGVGE